MLETLINWDKQLLVYLNGFHAPWLDPVMYYASQTITWLPLYLLLFILVIKNFKKETWIVLAGIALTILLADQITSSVMKPYFARLRPSHEPALQGLLHFVYDYKGGLYGFSSGHAANTFGTAMFFALLFKEKHKWFFLLFLWAVLMTYTRIYLGVHYPGDILVGGTIGLLCGYAGFRFFLWIKTSLRPGVWNRE